MGIDAKTGDGGQTGLFGGAGKAGSPLDAVEFNRALGAVRTAQPDTDSAQHEHARSDPRASKINRAAHAPMR